MAKDLYNILGVKRDASSDQIKRAYRKLAVKYHPDKNQGDTAASDRFKEASSAYEILSNEERRLAYDQHGFTGTGAPPPDNPFTGGFEDIFEQFFGSHRASQQHHNRRSPRKPSGGDIRVHMSVSFLEAALGCEKEIVLDRSLICDGCTGTGCSPGTSRVECHTCGGVGQIYLREGFMAITTTCSTCSGSGRVVGSACKGCTGRGRVKTPCSVIVQIPPGVDTGSTLRLAELGNSGPGGCGNLFVTIEVAPSLEFRRSGNDVIGSVELTVSEATLGCVKSVSTVHGSRKINIESGTQPGMVLGIKKMGIRDIHTGRMGSHNVEVRVTIPESLSADQRALFESLRAAGG